MNSLQIRSNIVRQVNPKNKSHSKSKPTYNYDMSILHDDELNNSYLAERRRPKKKIPFWANGKSSIVLLFFNNSSMYLYRRSTSISNGRSSSSR
jgi:hypothetical protein